MTFEYRNPTTGDRLAAVELDGDVWLKTTPKGCLVPPDRVEEVVAGIRDAARTAAARQTTGQDGTGWEAASERAYRPVPLTGIRIDRLATTTAPAASDSGQYPRQDGDTTVLGPEIFASSDGQVISWRGMNYVPQPAPAVGQPAEAHDTDEALLTASERKFLHYFALDEAAEEMSLGDGFTDVDQAALDRLRLLAGKDER
ncbi:hypothetical protein ACGFZH_28165 [Streptomyces zaomyceticus]|uniref:hypothetical protein n=1 Tax=Streptomyces zaomyceticus TaxID=68286 RepID=UPI00370FE093